MLDVSTVGADESGVDDEEVISPGVVDPVESLPVVAVLDSVLSEGLGVVVVVVHQNGGSGPWNRGSNGRLRKGRLLRGYPGLLGPRGYPGRLLRPGLRLGGGCAGLAEFSDLGVVASATAEVILSSDGVVEAAFGLSSADLFLMIILRFLSACETSKFRWMLTSDIW